MYPRNPYRCTYSREALPHYRGCSEWEHPACPTRKKHGKKQRAVQAGIESAVLVEVSALHFNLAQHIVPSITSFLHQRVKTVRTQFEQVPLSLFVADKRRSNTGMHNLAFLRLKSDNRTCMGSLLLFLRFLNYTVFNRSGICKGLSNSTIK